MRQAIHIPSDAEQAAKREEFEGVYRAERPAVSMEAIAEERKPGKIMRHVKLRLSVDASRAMEQMRRAREEITRAFGIRPELMGFHTGGVFKGSPLRGNELAVIMSTPPEFPESNWVRQRFEDDTPPRHSEPFAWPRLPSHSPEVAPGQLGLVARGRGSVKFMDELLGLSETEMKRIQE